MNYSRIALTEDEQRLLEAFRKSTPTQQRNFVRRSKTIADTSNLEFASKFRKELNRLELKKSELMLETATDAKKALRSLTVGEQNPTFDLLKYLAWAGMDVNYLITGHHQSGGIGNGALYYGVQQAVNMLSLENKLDAKLLANTVIKLSEPHRRTAGILPVSNLYAKARSGVVRVYKHDKNDVKAKRRQIRRHSSGTVIGNGTTVLTCAHSVQDCKAISVHVNGEIFSYPGEVIYTDDMNDLALVKVEGKVGEPLPMDWKLTAMVGDGAAIIGYPFTPVQQPSLVTAHISAHYDHQFRLDTDVYGGHSGSPLLNLKGEVIGIVRRKFDSLPELLNKIESFDPDLDDMAGMYRQLLLLNKNAREIRENRAHGMGEATSIEALIQAIGKRKLQKMISA